MSSLYKRNALALAAVFFYAPLVHYYLHKGTYDFDKTEQDFIKGYVRIGYMSLSIVILLIVLYIWYILGMSGWLMVVVNWIMYGLIALLIGSSLLIVQGKVLFSDHSFAVSLDKVKGDPNNFIQSYLPGNNLVLRYRQGSFDHPIWRVKESLLLWLVFVLEVVFFNYAFCNILLLVMILARVASLILEVDLLPLRHKQRLHGLFHVNIEELRGYVSGLFLYIVDALQGKALSLSTYIEQEKGSYSVVQYIHSLDDAEKRRWYGEYILLVLVLGWMTYSLLYTTFIVSWGLETLFPYVALCLIIFRYGFAWYGKKTVHIPLIYDLVRVGQWLFGFIRK